MTNNELTNLKNSEFTKCSDLWDLKQFCKNNNDNFLQKEIVSLKAKKTELKLKLKMEIIEIANFAISQFPDLFYFVDSDGNILTNLESNNFVDNTYNIGSSISERKIYLNGFHVNGAFNEIKKFIIAEIIKYNTEKYSEIKKIEKEVDKLNNELKFKR